MARRTSDGAEGQRRRQARRGSQTATPKKRKGVCWGQPVLTTADHVESDDDQQDVERFDVLCGASLDEDPPLNSKMRESNRTKRLRAAVPFSKTDASPVGMGGMGDGQQANAANTDSSKAAVKKLKRAEAAAGKIRMSTSVPSLAELPSDGGAGGSRQGGVASEGSKCLATAPALVGLPAAMRQYMAAQSFFEPTALQTQAWEAAERRVDVLAQAPPGSGKTLAYLLPIASLLLERGHGRNTRPASPLALIIAPTHELAQQIHRAAVPLQQLFGLRCTCVHGGASREEQLQKLQQQPHILVATPGRLLDFADAEDTSLSQVTVVALDECDRMLSLGFAPELSRLRTMLLEAPSGGGSAGLATAAQVAAPSTTETPANDDLAQFTTASNVKQGKKQKQRRKHAGDMQLLPCMPAAPFKRPQVLMVSATMPAAALQVAEGWLAPNAERVHVSHAGSDLISSSIIQVVHVCAQHKKLAKLLKHLHGVHAEHASARHAPRVLVFANTTKAVNTLSAALREANFKCASLHGKRTHEERGAALHAFKAGKVQVLVATDVAARGLHIPRLPYIVNYDFPSNLETYVHRVGRTGRLEANGHAFSFITRNLAPLAHDLVDLLTRCEQAVDPNLLKLKEAYAVIQQKLQPNDSQTPAPQKGGLAHADEDAAGEACAAVEAHEGEATHVRAKPKNAKKNTMRKGACSSDPEKSEGGSRQGHGCESDRNTLRKGLGASAGEDKKLNKVQQGSTLKKQGSVGDMKKKKRRRREDKRAAAGLDAGKKVKQGILGPPRTEIARLAYVSGDDSD